MKRSLLNEDTRRLALTPQIVREYLAVATRPIGANGLGLSGSAAVGNIQQFLEDISLLSEGITSTRGVMDVVDRGGVGGKQVHDANIVAVAVANDARTIVTANTRHFARFADVITVEGIPSPQVW